MNAIEETSVAPNWRDTRKFRALAILLSVGMILLGGFALYRLGQQNGLAQRHTNAQANPAQPSATALVDPSDWGIPEGEAATRRHLQQGLKAGQLDPETGRKILYYHDPMVPGQQFAAPGKSPFMEMMLVPVYALAQTAGNEANAAASKGKAVAPLETPGLLINPEIAQNLGIRLTSVRTGMLKSALSAVGSISWNERGQSNLQARAAGFVEKLYVKANLDAVRKGQPLFDIYVPEWVAVQEDYLLLRRMQQAKAATKADADTAPNYLANMLQAARQRMRQVGMQPAQIAQLERSGLAQTRYTLFSPADGVLTELAVREGNTVMPGTLLARINDLSSVWAQAEVPQSHALLLTIGGKVTASSTALPGMEFEGKLQALLPEIDPATRTRKARVELRNPGQRLLPGMFLQMQLTQGQDKPALLLASEALIRTGQRVLVVVAEGGQGAAAKPSQRVAFRPVEVRIGREQDGLTEILSGLKDGQMVVQSGQFLLDSEASLKGVATRLLEPSKSSPTTAPSRGQP